ncbi:MAG: HAD family phosphatase [Candidatus Omnitrophica bacterium]|nr:HAD family phosphatase [Candidatus Omnitrophota bacterium]
MIKVIIFDLGQVVVRFDYERAFKKIVPCCKASLEKIMTFFTRSEADRLFIEGKINSAMFFQAAKSELKFDMDIAQFSSLYNSIFEPNKNVEDIIVRLKDRYTLAALSNTNELHFNYLMETFPVMKLFDTYILSYKEKCQKPDPVIFQQTLSRLHSRAEEIIFIDDTKENVVAAKKLGINTIHYGLTTSRLVEELEMYGVKIS